MILKVIQPYTLTLYSRFQLFQIAKADVTSFESATIFLKLMVAAKRALDLLDTYRNWLSHQITILKVTFHKISGISPKLKITNIRMELNTQSQKLSDCLIESF